MHQPVLRLGLRRGGIGQDVRVRHDGHNGPQFLLPQCHGSFLEGNGNNDNNHQGSDN